MNKRKQRYPIAQGSSRIEKLRQLQIELQKVRTDMVVNFNKWSYTTMQNALVRAGRIDTEIKRLTKLEDK